MLSAVGMCHSDCICACQKMSDSTGGDKVLGDSTRSRKDASMMGNVVHPDDDMVVEKTICKMKADSKEREDEDAENDDAKNDLSIPSLPHVSSMLVADTLLALCHMNTSPATHTDPADGPVLTLEGALSMVNLDVTGGLLVGIVAKAASFLEAGVFGCGRTVVDNKHRKAPPKTTT